jgi:hypothetical protein
VFSKKRPFIMGTAPEATFLLDRIVILCKESGGKVAEMMTNRIGIYRETHRDAIDLC